MELIASKVTVCPGCGGYIDIGQGIVPYGGAWYHASCDFIPRFSGTSRVSVHSVQFLDKAQERNERIRKYRQRYPEFSVRDLAEYLGYSKSTVARVLQEQARQSRQAASAALHARANLSSTGRR